jgi:hypothetical protein
MPSGGIVGDNLGQFAPEVIFAIATSEVETGPHLGPAPNDGKLWYTRDGGSRWNDVSKNVGMPALGRSCPRFEPSHFSGGTAYIASTPSDGQPRAVHFKTTDYGATWKPGERRSAERIIRSRT